MVRGIKFDPNTPPCFEDGCKQSGVITVVNEGEAGRYSCTRHTHYIIKRGAKTYDTIEWLRDRHQKLLG